MLPAASLPPRRLEIRRTALVIHPAADMFRLVEDVERYPEFLSWCRSARLLERTDAMQLASIEVAVAGVAQSFTTRNRLEPGQRLTLSLVDGPFRQLGGEWRFLQLGNAGSRVSLELTFDFASTLLSAAFRRGFSGIADRLVADFCRRADLVFGRQGMGGPA